MGDILKKLFDSIPSTSFIVRIEIREDEEYGKAIVERFDGTPQTWEYNNETGCWQ